MEPCSHNVTKQGYIELTLGLLRKYDISRIWTVCPIYPFLDICVARKLVLPLWVFKLTFRREQHRTERSDNAGSGRIGVQESFCSPTLSVWIYQLPR